MACNQNIRAFGTFDNAKTAEAAILAAVVNLGVNGGYMCAGGDCKDGDNCGFLLTDMALTSLTVDANGWDARVDGQGSCECLPQD